ncbi:dTDP-4-dehydrorhamnose 3,5-epimerase family protein [Candidatus Pacearchaeota archaeon]|nr:dTDP-4-dehydrorhamnose 3,5-epimerase family protein [Candidatus Pacearchaeota archaeon]
MKILSVKSLELSDVKIIRFARFLDNRGYFSEPYRKSDLIENSGILSLEGKNMVQANHSYSTGGVVRGLHFQWNPYMGKLVRTLTGRMVDLVLDIRKGSPYFGKIVAYNMPASNNKDYDEWIWVPPGFAHGNYFSENTNIEYLCTGEYSSGCESGISPLAKDLDWSLCNSKLKEEFSSIVDSKAIISDKDKNAYSIFDWEKDSRSENFIYSSLKENKLS